MSDIQEKVNSRYECIKTNKYVEQVLHQDQALSSDVKQFKGQSSYLKKVWTWRYWLSRKDQQKNSTGFRGHWWLYGKRDH